MLKSKLCILLMLFILIISIIPVSAAVEYEVVNIAFINNTGGLCTDMKAGQTVYIAASVEKTGAAATSPIIIIAVYSPTNALYQNFIIMQSGMLSGQTLTISPSFTLPENFSSYYVKAYVWDSLANPSPLSGSEIKYITNEGNTTPVPIGEENLEEPPAPDTTKLYRVRGAIEATPLSDNTIKSGYAKLRIDEVSVTVNENTTWELPNSPYTDLDYIYSGGCYYNKVKTGSITDIDNYLDLYCEFILKYNDYYMTTTINSVSIKPINNTVQFKTEDIYDSRTTTSKIYILTDKETGEYESYDVDIEKLYINGRNMTNKRITLFNDYGSNEYIDAGTEIDKTNAAAIFSAYANSDTEADIKLLCNTIEGNEYNVAYITDYDDYVVDYVNLSNNSVISKDARKIIFNEENPDYRFEIFKDGNKISLADIKVNDVLSIAGYINYDKELEYGKVFVNSTPVKGLIRAYDSSAQTLLIDNTVYNFNYEIVEALSNREIRLGDMVSFAVNARGILVGVLGVNEDIQYAFATTLSSNQIRFVNKYGNWDALQLNSTVKFNGGESESLASADLPSKIKNINNTGTATILGSNMYLINKIIAYKINSSGYIDEIYFVPVLNDYTYPLSANEYSDILTYNKSTNSLDSVNLKNDTVLFSLSADLTNSDPINESDISVGKILDLIDNRTYAARAYNITENTYAGIIIGKNLIDQSQQETVPISYDSSFMVVSNVTASTNAYGDIGYNLTGTYENQVIELFITSDTRIYKATDYSGYSAEPILNSWSYDNISKGDVILFSKNFNDQTSMVYIIAKASDINSGSSSPDYNAFGRPDINLYTFTTGNTDYKYIFGYVYNASPTILSLANSAADAANIYKEMSTATDFALTTTTYMACFDQFYYLGRGRTTLADISAISFDRYADGDGDYVLIRVRDDTIIEDVVIYKTQIS